jgi:hypothetical protein
VFDDADVAVHAITRQRPVGFGTNNSFCGIDLRILCLET